MNFEAIIGLEIHVELKTNSKMFSNAPVSFGKEANTCVVPLDVAFPGTMPTVNKQAVIYALRMCNALHMNIDSELWFDRKNYFYSDLPKGYQITQKYRPLGTDGRLNIGEKDIGIISLHLEEDTCKQIHQDGHTLLDFNRAGIPLIEIVSKPEIRNGKEARAFVKEIRSISSSLEISDGKMEEGSIRCDVNISIRPIGSNKNGVKVEIKNLNSLNNIEKAIDFEIKRQEQLLLSGGFIEQETRRYDESRKETVSMRVKEDSVRYKYFVEPNILPIKITKELIDEAIKTSPELPGVRLERYKKYGLSQTIVEQIVIDKGISVYFDDLVSEGVNPKSAANWITTDIKSVLNKKNISLNEFAISSNRLASLLKMIDVGKISHEQGREIFAIMQTKEESPDRIIEEMGVTLISDEGEIVSIIKEVLKDNPESIIDYKNGKDKAVGYLVGQVMKKTNGKANPALANKLLIKELKER